MNDFHEMLLKRHSIRRYTDQDLNPDDVKTILEAALLAPSSKSARSWQFVVIEDRDMLERLSHLKPAYAASVKDARLAVVVTSDPAKSEAYIEDASVAAIFMHLQAEALGIGSCWVQIRGRMADDARSSEDYVRDLLAIPEGMNVECVMTFGYSAETRKPVDPSKLQWEKVHCGTWNNGADKA